MTRPPPARFAGPKRVFSGIQPSGDLHLGNYLGALVKFVALQNEVECLFCVVDLHAITAWQEPAILAAQTRAIAAAYLAAGVDPSKAIIFAQSHVPQHAELAWVFNCVARLGWLDRMTQFKEKSGQHKERASVGLYDYPVLQAADILLYKATHVPVGEDQRQHLELTRDIAAKFNHDFDVPGFFPLTEALVEGPGARVMSLRDGRTKMAKSDPAELSRINLSDSDEAIRNKIRKARTDPAPLPTSADGLAGRPEAENLVGIYAALSGEATDQILARHGGKGFGDGFKDALADALIAAVGPVREAMARLVSDPGQIDAVLAEGAERARVMAEPVLAQVREIVGFLPRR
jgi:tryptophanyl-tRNA synthetase